MIKYFVFLAFFSTILIAASQDEAVPWTKSLLESRIEFSVERLNSKKHLGRAVLSSAPFENWEFDLGLSGWSGKDIKADLRAEKQILSDLVGDSLALSGVAHLSKTTQHRALQPIYGEMSPTCGEIGVGLGRHLALGRHSYTQLFTYLTAGIGSHASPYGKAEIGLWRSFSHHQALRSSLSHVRTMGRTRYTRTISAVSVMYVYHFSDGIEGKILAAYRLINGSKRDLLIGFGVSLPLSF